MRKMNKIAVVLTVMFLLCLAGCGESKPDKGPSNPINPINPNPVPLTAPQQIDVQSFDRALLISFTAVAQAEKYDLWYGTNSENYNGSGNTPLGKNVLRRNIHDDGTQSGPVSGWIESLENDKEYYIWINADFGSILGESGYTKTTGMPMSSPLPPTGLKAIAGENLIEVRWNGIDTPARYAYTYDLSYSTATDVADECRVDAAQAKATAKSGYVIKGLCNGVEYVIQVRAINANGPSDYSEAITATPELATVAPDNLGKIDLEQRAKRLKATWDAVSGAAYYELFYNDASSYGTLSDSTCEYPQCMRVEQDFEKVNAEITGLTNGRQYHIQVKAVNHAGSSDSLPSNGTPNKREGINLNNMNFVLGIPVAEYIFGEDMPPFSPLSRDDGKDFQDNLHRSKETPIGNLFTDSALWYLNIFLDPEPDKKVDFVFLNSGYIDSRIRPQDPAITVGSLRTIVANSPDKILILEMKGSDIKELFEYAVRRAPHMGYRGNHSEGPGEQLFRSSGSWPIVSKGLSYTIKYPFVTREFMNNPPKIDSSFRSEYYFADINEPIERGTLKLNGVEIDDNKTYRVATTDYNEEGRYIVPMRKTTIKKESTNIPYWHAVAEYLYDSEYVTPAIDGRVKIKGGVIGGPFGVAEGYNQYCPADATYSEVYGCRF